MSVYKKDISEKEVAAEKSVHLHLQSGFYILAGEWEWGLHSDTVFCSDVMLTLPPHFLGTKGIVHPDDVAALAEVLAEGPGLANFNFRIITTYGKVVTLKGAAIEISEAEPFIQELAADNSGWVPAVTQQQLQKENKRLRRALTWATMSEKHTGIGTFYFNTSTYDIHFSDNLYRLFGVMPQSLNAHLKTFYHFLHPDDAAAFSDAFDKAFRSTLPLHIYYRIVNAMGEVKYQQLITSWDFNENGELILGGLLMDITGQKKAEGEWQAATDTAAFLQEQLNFSEQVTGMGIWQLNIFTRKSIFSDNFYRIHGLKPQIANLNLDMLVNLAHPEDRELVTEAHRKILAEHVCPEIEYRIIRNDGKVRYVQLKGKSVVRYKTELWMVGTIKDVTTVRKLEKRERKLTEELLVQQEVEVTAQTSVWLTDLQTGEATWSPSFFPLLGYKANFIELTQKLFTNFIHPEDKKRFTETLNQSLQQKEEHQMVFRLIVRGAVRQVKASFKNIQAEGKNLFAVIVQDVNNETALQQQQHDMQQWLDVVTNAITEKVFVTDSNNTIIDINKAGKDAIMEKSGPVLHKNLFDVFPHLQEGDYRNHLELVLHGKTASLPAGTILKRAAGNYLLFPLLDKAEKVHKVVHVIKEATAEYALQRKVALNFRLVESIVELMPGRVIILDKNMNYVYWNGKCEAHYGLRKEQVIGKNILEFLPGFYNDPGYNEFKKTLAGEVVSITLPPEDYNAPQTELLLVPVADNNQSIEFILWMVFDSSHTSELNSEEALKGI